MVKRFRIVAFLYPERCIRNSRIYEHFDKIIRKLKTTKKFCSKVFLLKSKYNNYRHGYAICRYSAAGVETMAIIQHPRNYEDNSTENGFQFTFFCDICGNGFRTQFIKSKTAAGTRAIGFASRLASCFGYNTVAHMGSALPDISAGYSKEKDEAFVKAVNECMTRFRQCPKCKRFTCEFCHNADTGLCTECAPVLNVELQAARTQRAVDQMKEKVQEANLFDGNIESRPVVCPVCNKIAGAGKFCSNCGASLIPASCPRCGNPVIPNSRFCNNCGNRLG